MDSRLILSNAREVLTCNPTSGDAIGRLHDGALVIEGDKITAVGPSAEVVARYQRADAITIDCSRLILAPGFVDSHTHVVFGGSRVKEYALKMTHSADEIKAAGIPTGIVASMTMTRAESEAELLESASLRLNRMLDHGTTTAESKSGYGLSTAEELKMLNVNRRLDASLDLDVISTYLGAHAFPPDLDHESYVDQIINEQIPAVAESGLADFCDAYIDEGYFNLAQTRRILEAAERAGMPLKIHADQYSALGGGDLAAELAVVSADHLNYTSPGTVAALVAAGVVGVLMPMIDFATRHPKPFDARGMLDAGMRLALATDICPGGWTESQQLVMQFACREHAFSPEEALIAATLGGAQALALEDRGRLAPGLLADVQAWQLDTFEEVIYRLGSNAVEFVIKSGKIVRDFRSR